MGRTKFCSHEAFIVFFICSAKISSRALLDANWGNTGNTFARRLSRLSFRRAFDLVLHGFTFLFLLLYNAECISGNTTLLLESFVFSIGMSYKPSR